MALFKSEEEKRLLEQERLKKSQEIVKRRIKEKKERIEKYENEILNDRVFKGKVGTTHSGWTFRDGLRNADKTKFKKTKFQIFNDKLIIERNRNIVHFSDVKEIFYEGKNEAIIILDNGTGIPIKKDDRERLTAFINILNKLIDENKSNTNIIKSDNNKINSQENSEDKFDKLIKLGEMHDKGLLSDEEFASLKQELLSENNNEKAPVENNIEASTKYCGNCGAEVSPDNAFCTECGTQINNN